MTIPLNGVTVPGGPTVDSETIAAKEIQRVKLVVGPVGTDSGDVSSALPLPVQQAAWPITAYTPAGLTRYDVSAGGGTTGFVGAQSPAGWLLYALHDNACPVEIVDVSSGLPIYSIPAGQTLLTPFRYVGGLEARAQDGASAVSLIGALIAL